jgi:hypothetical protein
MFSKPSISIGSQWTNGFSRKSNLSFKLLNPNKPRKENFDFEGGDPLPTPPPDVLAPAIVVSTTYYDLAKKKKFDF